MPNQSPRDSFGLFRHITTHVAVSPGPTATILAPENPDRVSLIIGAPATTVGVSPDSAMPAGSGIPAGGNGGALLIDQATYGALVGRAWYCGGGTGVTVTVIQQLVEIWPEEMPSIQGGNNVAIPQQTADIDCDDGQSIARPQPQPALPVNIVRTVESVHNIIRGRGRS